MAYRLIGNSWNRMPVIYDTENSHAATHFADTPALRALVKEVIAQTITTGEFMWFETDMGRVVGTTDEVRTDDTDEIVYAKRLNRGGYSRFTKSREPQPCSLVTVALDPMDEDRYMLTSAWIGPKGVPFPDAPAAGPESAVYWARHALVWGSQETVPDSERSDNPWV